MTWVPLPNKPPTACCCEAASLTLCSQALRAGTNEGHWGTAPFCLGCLSISAGMTLALGMGTLFKTRICSCVWHPGCAGSRPSLLDYHLKQHTCPPGSRELGFLIGILCLQVLRAITWRPYSNGVSLLYSGDSRYPSQEEGPQAPNLVETLSELPWMSDLVHGRSLASGWLTIVQKKKKK